MPRVVLELKNHYTDRQVLHVHVSGLTSLSSERNILIVAHLASTFGNTSRWKMMIWYDMIWYDIWYDVIW
jgi:hypothetical protein